MTLKNLLSHCVEGYIAHIKIPIEKMQKTQQIGTFSVASWLFAI